MMLADMRNEMLELSDNKKEYVDGLLNLLAKCFK